MPWSGKICCGNPAFATTVYRAAGATHWLTRVTRWSLVSWLYLLCHFLFAYFFILRLLYLSASIVSSHTCLSLISHLSCSSSWCAFSCFLHFSSPFFFCFLLIFSRSFLSLMLCRRCAWTLRTTRSHPSLRHRRTRQMTSSACHRRRVLARTSCCPPWEAPCVARRSATCWVTNCGSSTSWGAVARPPPRQRPRPNETMALSRAGLCSSTMTTGVCGNRPTCSSQLLHVVDPRT